MRSPEHVADLDRVLTRAAKEYDGRASWFGDGLASQLRRRLEAVGQLPKEGPTEVAFVDVRELSSIAIPKRAFRRVVALSDARLSEFSALVRAAEASNLSAMRLVCPFAVIDFAREGLRVREIRKGLTATDLQAQLHEPLWAGPDLTQMGSG